jgi:hypothetical protein
LNNDGLFINNPKARREYQAATCKFVLAYKPRGLDPPMEALRRWRAGCDIYMLFSDS